MTFFFFFLLNEVLCLLFSAMYYLRKYVLRGFIFSHIRCGVSCVALDESILMLLSYVVEVSGGLWCDVVFIVGAFQHFRWL
jgi:hypothetical protein